VDDRVTAVLETYHARMADERRGVFPDDGPGQSGRDRYLLPVGPESGQLINILASSLKAPNILEIGTSYGYSGIWLAEAARATGGKVTTLELQDYKIAYARDMAAKAGLADWIDFVQGDALASIAKLAAGIDFVLLDLWKDLYIPCLEAFYPKLNPGAIIVADNIIYPGGDDVQAYSRAVRKKPGMTSILVPVGAGLEISRYEP
jgi:predicted O-methyltransferase YrrM